MLDKYKTANYRID